MCYDGHFLIDACIAGDVDGVQRLLTGKSSHSVDTTLFGGNTALMYAIRHGHEKVAQVLLAANASVTETNYLEEDPLALAVVAGNQSMVRLLLDHGANVNSPSGGARITAVMRAAARGDEDMLRCLVEAGASLSVVDANGWNAREWAKEEGQTAMVRTLKRQYRMPARQCVRGYTRLMICAIDDNLPAVQWLLQEGVDLDAMDEFGVTALAYAAVCGHRAIVCELLRAGAAPIAVSAGIDELLQRVCGDEGTVLDGLLWVKAVLEVQAADDKTLLEWAVGRGHGDVVKLLLAAKADVKRGSEWEASSLDRACWQGNVEVVKLLLAAGAPVADCLHTAAERNNVPVAKQLLAAMSSVGALNTNATTRHIDGTALHTAAEKNSVDVIHLLLAAGADVHARNERGQTALHRAVAWGHIEAARALLDARADIHLRDKDGRTPFPICLWKVRVGTIPLLLAAGTDANAPQNDGRPPLVEAARCGCEAIVKILLAAGANVHADNDTGTSNGSTWTPLHYASYIGNTETMELLLAAGALIDRRDGGGFTALHRATQHQRLGAIRWLLARGARASTVDKWGSTILHTAMDSGCEESLPLLLTALAREFRSE